jgi:putative membrane protein
LGAAAQDFVTAGGDADTDRHCSPARPSELAMRLLLIWLINAIALLVLPHVISGVQLKGIGTALIVAVVLGLINAFLRPLLVILTLPVTVVTLGLFIFVINALLFWLASHVVKGFEVSGFWAALFGSLLYSLISWILSALVFGGDRATNV